MALNIDEFELVLEKKELFLISTATHNAPTVNNCRLHRI